MLPLPVILPQKAVHKSFTPFAPLFYHILQISAISNPEYITLHTVSTRHRCKEQSVSGFVSGFKKDLPVKYCAYAVFAFPVPNTFCFQILLCLLSSYEPPFHRHSNIGEIADGTDFILHRGYL